MALIIAPILLGLSTFFWLNGEYDVPAATLIILSMFFWIISLKALFGLLKDKMPRYAVWGQWIATFGLISGVGFAYLGYFSTIFNIPHNVYLKTLSDYPVSSQLLLFASGPIFPLSMLLLGINLIRTRSINTWVGILLCLGSIMFPLSRISRIDIIAHIGDLIFLIPCAYIGFSVLSTKNYFKKSLS